MRKSNPGNTDISIDCSYMDHSIYARVYSVYIIVHRIHLITYRLFMNNELRVLPARWWHVEAILACPRRLIKNEAIKVNGIINFAGD